MSEYGNDVINFAYSYVKNYHQAQDIAQDVFLKAFARMDTFREESSPKTWLLSITANRCRDYLRSWSKRHEQIGDEAFLEDVTHDETERIVLERLRKDRLWAVVGRLPMHYREVITLFYQRELSSQEVATVLGISEQTVRTRLHRGRQMLREMMGEGGMRDE